MEEKFLVFDIWGDYAYFRRGYTTTSTISFPFPSRTTIAGIISAILGLKRDQYYEIFSKEHSKIGLRILNPIQRYKFNLNYINTKDQKVLLTEVSEKGKRVQVQAEFLKNPKFRIYLSLDDEDLMNQLLELLKNHKSIYTPYLGISECLANFELVGDDFLFAEKEFDKNVDINSVILKEYYNILIEENRKYGLVKSPGFFDSERIVTEYLEYYFEEKGNSIKISEGEYYHIGDDNVILF